MDKIPDDMRKNILGHFNENRVIYLATDESGQPRVRPVTMVPIDDRYWVLTGTDDAKTRQIKENSKIEVCYPVEEDENTGYVRFSGKATIIKDQKIRTQIANSVSFFKHYFKGPEDPKFTLLELKFVQMEFLRPGELLASKYSL